MELIVLSPDLQDVEQTLEQLEKGINIAYLLCNMQ